MRRAEVSVHGVPAATLSEADDRKQYELVYLETYNGPAVSLTMPTQQRAYVFTEFPAFFDGLLPEGPQLDGLLRSTKLDRRDLFGQLVTVGQDMVGAVTVRLLS